jgi:hypothetical protein
MSLTAVKPKFVRKGKAVYLSKSLPIGSGFKNTKIIPAKTKGYVEGEGFVAGMLYIHFPMFAGDEHTQFNVESAAIYLECDPFF